MNMHPRRFLRRLKQRLRPYLIRGRLASDRPDFNGLFATPARIRRLAGGFIFTEGPVWDASFNRLLFTDIPGNAIHWLDPDTNHSGVFRKPSGNANGLALDNRGRLIACEHGNRRITRTELDGSITVLADNFKGARLNSPNDVAVAPDGSIFFTDPVYGVEEQHRELSVRGVYRCVGPGAPLQLLADDFIGPNGLAFTADGHGLYVDDSSKRCHIRAFSLDSSGNLCNATMFCNMSDPRPGRPDGMALDAAGRVYCTGPGGVWVLDKEGTRIGTIVIPEQPANCAFGGPTLQTLFITARTSVYAVTTTTPGLALPVGAPKLHANIHD